MAFWLARVGELSIYDKKVKEWEEAKEKWDNYEEIRKNREFVIEKAKENTIDRINEERKEAAKAANKVVSEQEETKAQNDNSSKTIKWN